MSSLQVLCLPHAQPRAADLAARLDAPLQILPDFDRKTLKRLASSLPLALMVGDDVSLQTFELPLPGPVRVDWTDGQTLWRLQHGGGRGEMLAKACGIKGDYLPWVVDATAGFGRDSLLLAWLGCRVTLLERSPVVRALLEDGWRRAQAEPLLTGTLARMELVFADSSVWLSGLAGDARPDVVYLDPMFPSREKSAKVKVNMQVFHRAVGADPDADSLLEPALTAAKRRVVVKRPRLAEPLAGKTPSIVFEGESSRFDVYLIS
jgi:16S rRNA (guanine1516-N2)-methyltransferase